ncbi:MAG: type II secretion system F family protein [Actinomycetota bacterium]|nr:type II secretion system F family protein [Actinomycetota bacterium]
MRGLAVLSAAGAGWLLVGGRTPHLGSYRPSFELRSVVVGVGSGLATFVLSYGLLGTVVPAAALGVLAVTVPVQMASSRDRKRQAEASAAWPDLLAHIRSSVAAGMTLPDSYLDAAQRTGGAFGETLDEVRRHLLFGGGFPAAMDVVRRAADDPTADRVTMTLIVANETGGHRVGDVLSALSTSIAGETRLRSAHDAAQTEQRWTAGVALAAPWVILALSIATNPQAATAFGTAEGAVVVGIGLALTIAGYLLSRKLAALSAAPRVFR